MVQKQTESWSCLLHLLSLLNEMSRQIKSSHAEDHLGIKKKIVYELILFSLPKENLEISLVRLS